MEIKKVNLSQTDFQSEEELKLYLRDLVLDYTSQMNEIESDIFNKSQAEKKAEPRKELQKDFFPEYKERYFLVFEAYCSEKRRVYGGQASSFGFPFKFNGIENYVEYSVELKNKNRAEVYFKTESKRQDEYLFVVVRGSGVWRIDNFKKRMYNEGKFDSGIL